MKEFLQFIEARVSESRVNRMKRIDIFYDGVCASECLSGVESKPGVYIIVSRKVKYIYPNGKSPVIYIGTSNNLKNRLKQHIRCYIDAASDWKTNEKWSDSRYNYILRHDAVLYYMYTYNEDCKTLESKCIESFYDKYRAIPVGNGVRSFR